MLRQSETHVIVRSDRLYFEVQRYEREDQCLQILHQIVENPQALRVLRLIHINQRADLSGLRNVSIARKLCRAELGLCTPQS